MFELTEEEKRQLDKEIEKYNQYLYSKYGKELVEKLIEELDKELKIALDKQFDNLKELDMEEYKNE